LRRRRRVGYVAAVCTTSSILPGRSARRLCAALLAASLSIPPAAAGILPAWIADFLTDAATRLARDVRDGADRLAWSRAATVTVVHHVKATPEGCAAGYRVQLTAASAIVVWCRSAAGDTTVASYTTTSHLPAVDVPRTWIVDKAAGEPLVLELARTGGKPAVTRVQ
jgi:hypothetical protein